MAVPSRIYFVITLFALVVTLVSLPFTVAVLTCESRPDPGLSGLPCSQFSPGLRIFLTISTVFTLTFTIMSWRALRAGARRDAAVRRERARDAQATQEAPNRASAREREPPGPPPGYE
ncbi:MAG: hypothetical protein V4510_11910 [bacterium]